MKISPFLTAVSLLAGLSLLGAAPAGATTTTATQTGGTVHGVTHAGESSLVKIVGTKFNGKPKTITSNAAETKVQLVKDGGSYLVIRVIAGVKSPVGQHTFTIVQHNSKKLLVKYTQTSSTLTPVVLTFNSLGGSTVANINGTDGTTITLPSAPTFLGYVFDGWFTAAAGGTALTSPYTLTGSVTLYAQWTADFNGTSTNNWAGYVLPVTNNSTSVEGSWTVPTLNCADTPNGVSDEWVGVNGALAASNGNNPPLVQTGVGSYCVGSGVQINTGWWEVVPSTPNCGTNFSNFNVSSGDQMTGKVFKNASDHWVSVLQDLTTGLQATMLAGGTYEVSQTSTGALVGSIQGVAPAITNTDVTSAEWIEEAPTLGNSIMALANFGSVTFSNLSQLSLTANDAFQIVSQSGQALTLESPVINRSFTVSNTGL